MKIKNSRLINHLKNENKNGSLFNTKTLNNIKNQNNILTNNIEDSIEIKDMKQKYLELSQENKKLKDEISNLKKNHNYKNRKENVNGEKISFTHKKSSSVTKKKYIQKPLTLGMIKNKSNEINKSISRSRIQTQAQTQTQLTINSTIITEEENTKNKITKGINQKTGDIPTKNEKENNALSLSKNSVDMGLGSGEIRYSDSLSNNINNLNNNYNLASMVLSFLKDMKTLQEKITQKVENVKELKKNFELKKREIKKYSESIIDKKFSSTYTGNNTNNIIPENLKAKSKEQSLKASIESFNIKENLNLNLSGMIKEYESKNKEQRLKIKKIMN